MNYLDKLSSEWSQKQVNLARSRWFLMKARCYNPNHKAYKNYGARGIKMCDRWLGEDGFYNYMVDMGIPPKGYTLDRIDNDKDYSPSNCRWASPYEQRRNQRRVKARQSVGLPCGVSLDIARNTSNRKHWLARLEVNGKRVLNKRFWTKEEAIEARLKAEKEYL